MSELLSHEGAVVSKLSTLAEEIFRETAHRVCIISRLLHGSKVSKWGSKKKDKERYNVCIRLLLRTIEIIDNTRICDLFARQANRVQPCFRKLYQFIWNMIDKIQTW